MKQLLGVLLCLSVLAAFGGYAALVSSQSGGEAREPVEGDLGLENSAVSLNEIPGVRHPHYVDADEVRVADDAEVLGICVNGDCRAYLISVLSMVESHIVNDVIGGKPVSVTFCDLADCGRVLTTDASKYPLDLSVGGIDQNKQLILLYEGRRYRQESQAIPLRDLSFKRMSWAKWKDDHPRSLVYVGGASERG